MVNWLDLYLTEDVDQAVRMLSDKLLPILDATAPMKTIQVRTRYAPWLSKKTLQLIKERDDQQKKASCQNFLVTWCILHRIFAARSTSEEEHSNSCTEHKNNSWQLNAAEGDGRPDRVLLTAFGGRVGQGDAVVGNRVVGQEGSSHILFFLVYDPHVYIAVDVKSSEN